MTQSSRTPPRCGSGMRVRTTREKLLPERARYSTVRLEVHEGRLPCERPERPPSLCTADAGPFPGPPRSGPNGQERDLRN